MSKDFMCESSEFNGPKCATQCRRCKPAPQPPVEGLREATDQLLQTLNSLSLGLLSPDQNETSSAMAGMASNALPAAMMLAEAVAALASPSLTARVEQTTLCEDCPPVGYCTDRTRCLSCPRAAPETVGAEEIHRTKHKSTQHI